VSEKPTEVCEAFETVSAMFSNIMRGSAERGPNHNKSSIEDTRLDMPYHVLGRQQGDETCKMDKQLVSMKRPKQSRVEIWRSMTRLGV
jgi:hypothetical protein